MSSAPPGGAEKDILDVGKSLDTNLNKDHAMMKTRWPTRDLNETSGPTKQNWLKWSICGEHLKSVAQVNEPLEAARARHGLWCIFSLSLDRASNHIAIAIDMAISMAIDLTL